MRWSRRRTIHDVEAEPLARIGFAMAVGGASRSGQPIAEYQTDDVPIAGRAITRDLACPVPGEITN
jgi:hypothetical protein